MLAFARNRVVWIVAVLVLIAGGAGLFMSNQAKAKKAEAEKVAAAHAPKSPYVAIANGKADVEGGIIQVAARSAGVVRDVLVQEGDDVVKGQVLARLDDDEARISAQRAAAEVSQAKAQIAVLLVLLSTANREYNRLLGLVATNFVAGQKLDQARDSIRAAEAAIQAQTAAIATYEARLGEARYMQELSVIRAPADGRIIRRYANPGAGASTLNVSNMFDLEPKTDRIVRAEISEGALPFVAIGQTVQIAPESDPTKTFTGKVIRRAAVFGARKLQSDDPSERSDERVVEVVVGTKNAPFLIGQRVLVKFMRTQQQAAAGATAAPKG
jgi:HlyD family secretion protein